MWGEMKHTRAVAAIAAASAVLLALATPASAAPPEIDHWTDHIEHIEQVEHAADNWCPDIPFDVRYVEDAHGTFRGMVRGDKFYGATTIRSESAWINVDTGKRFSRVWQGQDKDLKVVDNGDGTITLTILFTGPTKYYDNDGNRVFMDVGRTFNTIVIDEAGTPGFPDDDFFVEFVGSESKGSFDTMDRDFCADLMDFIG
jgi:hypothetical protein